MVIGAAASARTGSRAVSSPNWSLFHPQILGLPVSLDQFHANTGFATAVSFQFLAPLRAKFFLRVSLSFSFSSSHGSSTDSDSDFFF